MLFGRQYVQNNLDIYRNIQEYLTRRNITVPPITTTGNIVAHNLIQSIWTGADREQSSSKHYPRFWT